MTRLIIQMLLISNNWPIYIVIYALPIAFLSYRIYEEPMNYNSLFFMLVISIITAILVNEEVRYQEGGNKVHNYLRILESENYIYLSKTLSMFYIVSFTSLLIFLPINIIYRGQLLLSLQITYLFITIIFNFFFTYFVLYSNNNIKNAIYRNALISSVVFITILALMTKNVITYATIVALLGLFLAISVVNRRLSDELKREDDEY